MRRCQTELQQLLLQPCTRLLRPCELEQLLVQSIKCSNTSTHGPSTTGTASTCCSDDSFELWLLPHQQLSG